MASIHRKKLHSGKVVWELTHGDGKKRVRFTAGRTRREAEAALALFKRQLRRHGGPPEEVTVAKAVGEYRRHLDTNRTPGTARRYGRVLRTFADCFLPRFHPGVQLLREVKPKHLEAFKRRRLAGEIVEREASEDLDREERLRQELAKGKKTGSPQANAKYGFLGRKKLYRKVARRTVNFELQTLATFFAWAVKQNYLFTNPAEDVEKLRLPRKSLPKFLTAEELRAFFAACPPRLWRVFAIMFLSGMRKGELLNLTWEDVSFELGVILIREKEEWQPKSDERVIPISPVLFQILVEHCRHRRSDRWVVANKCGNQETHLLEKLKAVCRKAGIRQANLHMVRHSFAAHLRMAGTSLKDIGDLLGHQDESTTAIYAKVQLDHLRAVIGRLELPAATPLGPRPSLKPVTQDPEEGGDAGKLLIPGRLQEGHRRGAGFPASQPSDLSSPAKSFILK